ncbi:vacuolar ATPase assembly integral membrane protein vma21 [Linnemannia hyalina]|uniref:Vacuolar ATPase assembly integral membrane protein vma21 n=1 Tax=Linnemannia hyalina TaxID=64524 RepID=A0A9P7Y5I2_9FUNG|nr:vacuolar ATPase assembly integral membrane protein vma21 [Linnemannia hyalina]
MSSVEKRTTRTTSEQTSFGSSSSSSASSSSGSRSSVNISSSTLAKLAFFTVAMIVFPIATYFLTVDQYFGGNATYAGISAAVMANVILIAYVAVAVMEDSQAGPAPVSIKKQQ